MCRDRSFCSGRGVGGFPNEAAAMATMEMLGAQLVYFFPQTGKGPYFVSPRSPGRLARLLPCNVFTHARVNMYALRLNPSRFHVCEEVVAVPNGRFQLVSTGPVM